MSAAPVLGRRYTPALYAVGREAVRNYAAAVGETNPLHLDVEAARAAGFADVVAPPMFTVVYSSPAVSKAVSDPDVGIDFAHMVHGGQEFVWRELVVAGDEITTEASFDERFERNGNEYFVFRSRSVNQHGQEVCTGTWTNIVRRS